MSFVTMSDFRAWQELADASDPVTNQWLRPLQSYVVSHDYATLNSSLQPYIDAATQQGLANTATYLQTLLDNTSNPPSPPDQGYITTITNLYLSAADALNKDLANQQVSAAASQSAMQSIQAQQNDLIRKLGALQPGGVWNFGDALTAASAQQISPLQDQFASIQTQIRGATLLDADRQTLTATQQQIGNALSGANVQANQAGSSAGKVIAVVSTFVPGATPQSGADAQIQQQTKEQVAGWVDQARQCATNPASCVSLIPWWGWAAGAVGVLGVGTVGYLYVKAYTAPVRALMPNKPKARKRK